MVKKEKSPRLLKEIYKQDNLKKALEDLINLIYFTEDLSAKIHYVESGKKGIFRTIRKEFEDSKKYRMGIFLLTDDKTSLKMEETSMPLKISKLLGKTTGEWQKSYRINLNKAKSFAQVFKNGKTLRKAVSDIIEELFPRPVLPLILDSTGFNKGSCIMTPLNFYGKKIGVFIMSSVDLAEYLIPSVKNLAEHITAALERTDRQTRQKKIEDALRKSEEKFKEVFNSSPNAITIADLNGKIIDCNQATLDLHGFSKKKELIGMSAFSLITPREHRKAEKNMKKTLEQDSIEGIEYTFLTKKGQEFPAELSASVIRDSSGNPSFFIAITKDISERKNIDKVKDEFISIVSHQLRTPLTVMSWYSEMLLLDNKHNNRGQQEKYLKEIYIANQRLIELVNAFLNVSKIELGNFDFESRPINLIKTVNRILVGFSPQIKKKKLEIEKNYNKKPLIINTNVNLIETIFQNLLSNAIKYTSPGGKIKIGIIRDKSDLLVKVADNGYGIPKAQQSEVFKKLFRADNIIKKDPEGTGLGLYITKSLLECFGGEIWFESRENRGSSFYALIPLERKRRAS